MAFLAGSNLIWCPLLKPVSHVYATSCLGRTGRAQLLLPTIYLWCGTSTTNSGVKNLYIRTFPNDSVTHCNSDCKLIVVQISTHWLQTNMISGLVRSHLGLVAFPFVYSLDQSTVSGEFRPAKVVLSDSFRPEILKLYCLIPSFKEEAKPL